MKHRTIVITAANEGYAALAGDMLESLDVHREKLGLDTGVIDLGLAPTSRAALAPRVTSFVVPQWPFRPHARFGQDIKYCARATRPFLPQLFPGYETYVWLDSDTFVQAELGLRWLLDVARRGSVAAVPAVDRSYFHHPRQNEWLRQRYAMAFDTPVVDQLMQHAYVNSGVLAARGDSPVWNAWATRFQAALDRWDGEFLSDQAVLNAVLLLDPVPWNRLPSVCNWICHLALPRWHQGRRLFLEPSYPFSTLFIVHNTLTDKAQRVPLLDETGQKREMRLDYAAIRPSVSSPAPPP